LEKKDKTVEYPNRERKLKLTRNPPVKSAQRLERELLDSLEKERKRNNDDSPRLKIVERMKGKVSFGFYFIFNNINSSDSKKSLEMEKEIIFSSPANSCFLFYLRIKKKIRLVN